MIKELFSCLALLGALAGCANQPAKFATLNGESLAPMRTEKVAVSYSLATKKINYLETLFRGLWLESKTSSQDFSGIWSADRDLTSYTVPVLRNQGLNAVSAYDVVDAAVIQAANDEFGMRLYNEAETEHPEIKGTKLLPNPNYFARPVDSQKSLTLIEQLKAMGFRYLVQLTAMDIYGNAIGYGAVVVMAQPNVRVIDLNSGKVAWSVNYTHSEIYQLGGDLKKLEIDSMARTKEGLQVGIAKLQIASRMNLDIANSR
jgi:hypothetical protein